MRFIYLKTASSLIFASSNAWKVNNSSLEWIRRSVLFRWLMNLPNEEANKPLGGVWIMSCQLSTVRDDHAVCNCQPSCGNNRSSWVGQWKSNFRNLCSGERKTVVQSVASSTCLFHFGSDIVSMGILCQREFITFIFVSVDSVVSYHPYHNIIFP